MRKDVYGLVEALGFQGNAYDLLSIESIQTTQSFIRHENLLQQWRRQQQVGYEVNKTTIHSVCWSGNFTSLTTVWFLSFASLSYSSLPNLYL